jgi:hypothetical protein
MNLLASFPRIVVLTWGRSGSHLLSEKLGRVLDTSPRYDDATKLDQFNTQDPWPLHVHLMLSQEFLSPYTVIFNVRESSTDAILSMILAQHHNHWHNFIANPTVSPEPFEFTNWPNIIKLCTSYRNWHLGYHKVLTNPNRFVVIYEHMVRNMSPSTTFLTTYDVAKSELILNYHQVKQAIQVHWDSMQAATEPFRTFQNSIDLIECIKPVQ